MIRSLHVREQSKAGLGAFGLAVCKQILNGMMAAYNRPAQRDRFAALQLRHLEDIGLTIAQRDDMLH